MNKQAFLEEVYNSAFEDELNKLAMPLGSMIPKTMTKTRHTVAQAVTGWRKGFRKIDKPIITKDQVESKVGKFAIGAAELPGKVVKQTAKKLYFNPDALPAAAVGSIIPIPGAAEASMYSYLAAKRGVKELIKRRVPSKHLRGFGS